MSKLKARALGSVNMNPPHYNDAFDLEEERANRLKERMKLMRAMAPPPPRSVQHGFTSGFLSEQREGGGVS